MKIVKLVRNGGFLLLLCISIFACKKDKTTSKPKDALTGAWHESAGFNNNRTLFFRDGGDFRMEMMDSIGTRTFVTYIGKYSILENKLKVNITSEVETSAYGEIIKTTPVNYTLFENGKFSINNFVLTINHSTSTAGIPTDTTTKYDFILPYD